MEPGQLASCLQRLQERTLFRFVTCGSVDDGKSTLMGRLLYDAAALSEDQLETLSEDSRKAGLVDGAHDLALLFDGLIAEREQGITIDTAYRFFSIGSRQFIVGDTPGHEQYTRNMVTGASTADAAVLLVDAQKGVQIQTRRHSYLATLLGVTNIAVAVNKMDLVDYSRHAFSAIEAEFRTFAQPLGARELVLIPTVATDGDNVTRRGARMDWYKGPTLLEYLSDLPAGGASTSKPFRMPVQWIQRSPAGTRAFAGSIASGQIRPGDQIQVLPTGRCNRVAEVFIGDRRVASAQSGQAVTLMLEDEIDVSRGDMLVDGVHPAEVAAQFDVTIIWLDERPLLPGRMYSLKVAAATVNARVLPLEYKVDVNTFERVSASTLNVNEVGVAQLQLDSPIAFEPYTENRDLGGGILIDRTTQTTVGAVLLRGAARQSTDVHRQVFDVDKPARAGLKGQQPCIIWFTGLSGAGKSTIANALERRLFSLGTHTYLLDGDNVRLGLNRDLGFAPEDRVENIRRVSEVARLMCDAGLIVLVSFISPYHAERQAARQLVGPDEFVEVFVDTPLELAEARDPKRLYKKARDGRLANFTGIDSVYEPPERPDIRIQTALLAVEEAVDVILLELRRRKILEPPFLEDR
jgi:bifunctional enzyme CysN/CysC